MTTENPDSLPPIPAPFTDALWKGSLDPFPEEEGSEEEEPLDRMELTPEAGTASRSHFIQEVESKPKLSIVKIFAYFTLSVAGILFLSSVTSFSLGQVEKGSAKPAPTPRLTPGITITLDLKNSSQYEMGICSRNLGETINTAEEMFATPEHNEDNIQVAKLGEEWWCVFYNGPKG